MADSQPSTQQSTNIVSSQTASLSITSSQLCSCNNDSQSEIYQSRGESSVSHVSLEEVELENRRPNFQLLKLNFSQSRRLLVNGIQTGPSSEINSGFSSGANSVPSSDNLPNVCNGVNLTEFADNPIADGEIGLAPSSSINSAEFHEISEISYPESNPGSYGNSVPNIGHNSVPNIERNSVLGNSVPEHNSVLGDPNSVPDHNSVPEYNSVPDIEHGFKSSTERHRRSYIIHSLIPSSDDLYVENEKKRPHRSVMSLKYILSDETKGPHDAILRKRPIDGMDFDECDDDEKVLMSEDTTDELNQEYQTLPSSENAQPDTDFEPVMSSTVMRDRKRSKTSKKQAEDSLKVRLQSKKDVNNLKSLVKSEQCDPDVENCLLGQQSSSKTWSLLDDLIVCHLKEKESCSWNYISQCIGYRHTQQAVQMRYLRALRNRDRKFTEEERGQLLDVIRQDWNTRWSRIAREMGPSFNEQRLKKEVSDLVNLETSLKPKLASKGDQTAHIIVRMNRKKILIPVSNILPSRLNEFLMKSDVGDDTNMLLHVYLCPGAIISKPMRVVKLV